MSEQKKIKEMSFEEALKELQEIVRQIELGKDSLDDMINQYERGNQLKKHCETKLKEAKLRVEKIVQQETNIAIETLEIPEQPL